jgi:hypothetical protein
VAPLVATFMLASATFICAGGKVASADTVPPPAPAYLQTTGQDTATPTVSGIVQDPQDRIATGKFFVTDPSGNPVGGTPTAYGDMPSGQRVTYRFPDGALQPGTVYHWSMQACVDNVCSDVTTAQTVRAGNVSVPSAPSEQPTTSKTITGTALASFKGMSSSQSNCSSCGVTAGGDLRVGADITGASAQWTSGLKPDLSAIPAGARIITASLNLSQCRYAIPPPPPGGHAAMRPNGVPVPAYWTGLLDIFPADSDVAAASTGAQLAAAADTDAAASDVGSRQAWDITSVVQSWVIGDTPNDGLVLKAHNPAEPSGAFYCSPTQSESAASITVTYEAPAAPGKPQGLVVTAGDSGLRAHWSVPTDAGDQGGVTGYVVQVVDPSGNTVSTVSTDDDFAVVNGLTNGTAYTVRVAALNADGTGQPAVLVTPSKPVAVAGGAGQYVQAAQQFLDARQGLDEGVYPNAAAAIQASSAGALFGDRLTMEAPQDLAYGADMRSAGEGPKNGVNSLTNTLAVPSADGSAVSVYTTDQLTYSTDIAVTDPPDGSVTCCGRLDNLLFGFSAQGAPKLTGLVDASDAEDQVGSSSDVTAASDTLGDFNDSDGNDPAPLDTSAAQPTPAPSIMRPNIFYPNRRGIQSWAWNNAYHRNFNGYGDDCTDFVSMALHIGGGMKMTSYWKWHAHHTNDHYWAHDWSGSTYSWGGAPHLAQYLANYGSDWVRYYSQANYGNIVFANWRGGPFNRISHTGVIVGVYGTSDFIIAQHSRNVREWFHSWVSYARSHGHEGTFWVASVHSK